MLHFRTGRDAPGGSAAAAPAPDEARRGPEQQLHEAVRRAARAPQGRMALVLHLSHLPPPGPRPHHRRVARAILEDTAQRHEGQVFALGNGDMVLLCRTAGPGREAAARPGPGLALPDPAALPDTMARLLRVDLPDPSRATSVWRLEDSLPELTAYVTGQLAAGVPPAPPPASYGPGQPVQTGVVDAIAAIAEGIGAAELVRRQTGVLVAAPHRADPSAAPALRPFYREVAFSIDALEARASVPGQAAADPFLFRHLAGRLDRRMLALLANAAGTDGTLDIAGMAAGGGGVPALHVNLSLPAILSDAFARFALLCRGLGTAVGIEVSFVEACGDPGAFARARRLLAEAGLLLVLDGVSHLALMLARPCGLRPDLVKLDWSARLPALPAEESAQVRFALERVGPHRMVLQRADTEAAVSWGMAQGIRRFQGRYVDVMLAAARITACPHAGRCTLGQCVERAAAMSPALRRGCAAPDLLDGAPPPRVAARARASAA